MNLQACEVLEPTLSERVHGTARATDPAEIPRPHPQHPGVGPARDSTSNARWSCGLCGQRGDRVLADGVRDFEYGASGVYQWRECGGCGLVRLAPLPSKEVLNHAYPPDYQAYRPHTSKLVGWYVGRRRRERAAELARLLPENGTVLDVGCGTGELLSQLGRLGAYRLLGVEYRAEAAEQARRRGLTVWTGELEDARIEAGSLHLAIMEHVIEHVWNPRATLERMASLLSPGGVLVGETPNIGAWEARCFGRYWGGGHAPRHLTLFGPQALERLLRRCGFSEITIRHPVYPAHLALSVQNWIRGRRNPSALPGGRTWYYPALCCAAMPMSWVAAWAKQSGVLRFEARREA